MNETISIELGALAPSIKKQLGRRIEKKDAEMLQADADAITRLSVRGYLTRKQAHTARNTLMKNLQKVIK